MENEKEKISRVAVFIDFLDLKPANVLIARREPSMMIKLTDFGLSRKFDMTNAGARTECGTPYYNAPERMKDDEYGFPSEVWSLGCILYEVGFLVKMITV